MKIAGFNFSKKQLATFGVVLIVIILMCMISSANKQKRLAEEQAEARKRYEEALSKSQQTANTGSDYDFDAIMQAQLVAEYGEPPEGFKWDMLGNLVALSDESSFEDVLYTYVRALSMLDFSTAQRYSSRSNVISVYESYYSEASMGYANYYSNFVRKQYTESIKSMELESVSNQVIMADGTIYTTLNIKALDLTDKDFWLNDKDKIFRDLRVLKEVEGDSIKMNSYVYEYLISAYNAGLVGKKSYSADIVLTKGSGGGGWLISNDSELETVLHYEQGVDVAQYILSEFDSWFRNTTMQEQLDSQRQQVEEQKKLTGEQKEATD